SRILPTIWVHMCSVVAVSCHSANGRGGHGLDASFIFVSLLPVNEIGKRPLHFPEHSAGFFLCSVETVLDRSFRAPDDAGYLSLIVVAFDVLHGGPGKHALRSPHCAARATNIDCADGA